MMKSQIAMYFADITEDWPPDRRGHLLCACVKRLFTGNYGYPSVPVTAEETAALAHWDYPYVGRDYGLGPFRSPGKPGAEFTWVGGKKSIVDSEKVRAVHRYVQEQDGVFKLDKRLFKRTVREAMRLRFGQPMAGAHEWQHPSHIPGLEITTTVDYGGRRPCQLEYRQWVHLTTGGRRVWLLDYGGIDALLGWPQTRWCFLTNEDIPAAADLLVRLCGEFVDAVPGMLERSGLV